MVTVTVCTAPDSLTLAASGHAGAAPKGQDIVCAGVSILLTTLAAVVGASGEARLAPGNGYILCREPGQELKAAFAFAVTGLSLLANQYPDRVCLREERNTYE